MYKHYSSSEFEDTFSQFWYPYISKRRLSEQILKICEFHVFAFIYLLNLCLSISASWSWHEEIHPVTSTHSLIAEARNQGVAGRTIGQVSASKSKTSLSNNSKTLSKRMEGGCLPKVLKQNDFFSSILLGHDANSESSIFKSPGMFP